MHYEEDLREPTALIMDQRKRV